MKRIIILLSFMLIFLYLYSCTATNEVSLQINDKIIPISNIANPFLCVQLKDCGPSSIIADIDRIIYWENKIYVFDDTNDNITCNDISGKMIVSTQKYKGHGKNEYIHMSDMTLDETSGLIYALCDTPSEIIIFDKALNIISVTPIKSKPIEMCMDSKHLILLCRNYSKGEFEILSLPKEKLDADPSVILTSKIVNNRIMSMGRCLSYTSEECWASLPFNNCIYRIKDGDIEEIYKIDFRDNWYKDNGYKAMDFLEINRNHIWGICNIQKCGQFIWFNTNREWLYRFDIKNKICQCYDIIHDSIPFATQMIIPQQGMQNKLSFYIMPSFVNSYLNNMKKHSIEGQKSQVNELAINNVKEKNALVTFWEMK